MDKEGYDTSKEETKKLTNASDKFFDSCFIRQPEMQVSDPFFIELKMNFTKDFELAYTKLPEFIRGLPGPVAKSVEENVKAIRKEAGSKKIAIKGNDPSIPLTIYLSDESKKNSGCKTVATRRWPCAVKSSTLMPGYDDEVSGLLVKNLVLDIFSSFPLYKQFSPIQTTDYGTIFRLIGTTKDGA